MDAAITSHHTAWVQLDHHARTDGRRHAVAVRYAVSGEMLVAFGDGPLGTLPAGTRTWVTVHEIAGGPPLVSFPATLTDIAPDAVDREALLELLAHVALGRDLATVNRRVEEIAASRRVVGLVP